MTTLTVKPKNKKELSKAKKMLKVLDICFENNDSNPYNEDFVAMIEQNRKDHKEGKGVKMTIEQMEALWK
jgi:hypothetical protein